MLRLRAGGLIGAFALACALPQSSPRAYVTARALPLYAGRDAGQSVPAARLSTPSGVCALLGIA